MKTTKGLLAQAYNLLAQAKLDKCDVKERVEVVRALRSVRAEVESIQGFIAEVQKANADTDAVQLSAVINEELAKDAETQDIIRVSEQTMEHLVESNEAWNAAVIMAVEDVFGV